MVRAAATGVIDFREARLFDRDWWRRLNWLLAEVETKECQKLVELKYLQHASALDYQSGNDAFKHHWKALNELYTRWLVVVFPWMKDQVGGHSDDRLFEAWKRIAGDPSSPEVAGKINKAIQDLANRDPAPNVNQEPNLFGRTEDTCPTFHKVHSRR